MKEHVERVFKVMWLSGLSGVELQWNIQLYNFWNTYKCSHTAKFFIKCNVATQFYHFYGARIWCPPTRRINKVQPSATHVFFVHIRRPYLIRSPSQRFVPVHSTEHNLSLKKLLDADRKYMVQTLTTMLMTYDQKPSCLIVAKSLVHKHDFLKDRWKY